MYCPSISNNLCENNNMFSIYWDLLEVYKLCLSSEMLLCFYIYIIFICFDVIWNNSFWGFMHLKLVIKLPWYDNMLNNPLWWTAAWVNKHKCKFKRKLMGFVQWIQLDYHFNKWSWHQKIKTMMSMDWPCQKTYI
jgi:hypothetical protein